MSVHNGQRWLKEAIESVLSQLTHEDEFLIRDDGSTDQTLDILNGYDDEKIKIYSGSNLGLAASLNLLLEDCQGQYIARMDDDDISLTGRFEKQIEELNKRGLDLISSAKSLIDDEDNPVEQPFENLDESHLERFNGFTHGSWLFKKNIIESGFRYNAEFLSAQDYEMLLKLKLSGYQLGISKETTYLHRKHSNTITSKNLSQQQENMLRAQVWYWKSSTQESKKNYELCLLYFRRKLFLKSFSQLIRMIVKGHANRVLGVMREMRFHLRNQP